MKRRTFLSLAAGCCVAAAGGVTLAGARPPTAPRPTFADEFDGEAASAPDPTKWTYDLGGGGWGNDELEIYTDSRANSFLDGHGNLVIRATRDVRGSAAGTTTTYHSARLKTLGKFSQYQGTFEARIKLDIQAGAWPAWWMMGDNITTVGWPRCGEVDMLENYGRSATVRTSVHTPNRTADGVFTKSAGTFADDAWHTWRTRWGPPDGGFAFYKDGARYLTVEPDQVPDWCFGSGVPMFMLLNLAIGGTAAGPPPASTRFPVDMLVDYVRVW